MLTCARADVCMHVLLDLALFILTNLKGDCHDFKIVIAIKEPDFGVVAEARWRWRVSLALYLLYFSLENNARS